tara:strand:- start:930 stop:2243 length:1314 start_codon:yes stop_codon:yes gene_type:complete
MDDDRALLLGDDGASTSRARTCRGPTVIAREFLRFAALGIVVACALLSFTGGRNTQRDVAPQLGRTWPSAGPLARWAHMSIRAKVGGKAGARMFVPRDAHRVVVLTLTTSENMVDLYEWATSLNDVGVHKFMIGCADSPCLKTLQALDAPVFDASDLEGKFMFEGEAREDACRWAALDSALELLDLGYTVMLTKPTVRFRRNPMEVVADSFARHGGNSVFSMRGLHSFNVAPSDIGTWTVGRSLASLRDDFMVFTPGSQPLIRRTIDGFKGSDPLFVLNHVLSTQSGLRWKTLDGKDVEAAPFRTKPHEVTIDKSLLGANGTVPGATFEMSGVARIGGGDGDRNVTVVLLDTVVARAHCNDALDDAMAKTYVVGCDLDDRALAGRRIEIDHQCVLMKGLETDVGGRGLGLLGFFEHRGEAPIPSSKGFIGALRACRL